MGYATLKAKVEKLIYIALNMIPKGQETVLEEYIADGAVNEAKLSDDVIGKLNGLNENTNIVIENLKGFKWKSFENTRFATFTFDDSTVDTNEILALFKRKNVPCCFATIPSRLKVKCNDGRTIKDVLTEAQTSGCEILSHWTPQLNALSTVQDYIKCYVGAKKTLEDNGFNVNGVIIAGGGADGTPQSFKAQDWYKVINLCQPLYQYSDLISYFNNDLKSIEQYNNNRKFLSTFEDFKTYVDNYLQGICDTSRYSKWLNFASHGARDNVNIALLEQMIDYCISNNIQIVTWNTIYKKFKDSNTLKAPTEQGTNGQILGIENGLPKWVDNSSSNGVTYEKIASMTVDENNQTRDSDNRPYVDITKDLNGESFIYQKILIRVAFPTTITTNVYPYIQLANRNGVYPNAFGYGTKNIKLIHGTIERLPNKLVKSDFVFQAEGYSGSNKISAFNDDRYLIQMDGITAIRFMLRQTDMTIPTGTKISIWGIK